MPIYEYRCAQCGDFDVMQKITEKPLRKCPTCKGKVHKLVSNTSFQLKGSGWYVTDYAGKGAKGEASATDSGAKADSGSEKSSGSTETAEKSSAKPAKTGKSKGGGAADAA
jgi:putative FmdB family regulatory protein